MLTTLACACHLRRKWEIAVTSRIRSSLNNWIQIDLRKAAVATASGVLATVLPLQVHGAAEASPGSLPLIGCDSLAEMSSAECIVDIPGSSSSGGTASTQTGATPVMVDPCSYSQIDVANSMLNADRVTSEINETTTTTGVWYERSCPDGTVDTVSWAPPGGAAPAPALPSPQVLAQQAITSVTVTTPEVSLDPFYLLDDGRRATLKNAQTWLWVDAAKWVPLTPRVDVGPVWVQATITPQTLIVSVDDGVTGPYSCVGPGTPIAASTPVDEPSPTCSLQFTEQTDGGTWSVNVQVSYAVSWVGFDGTTSVSGTLPDLVSAPITIPLAVLAAKPELIDAAAD